MKISEMAVRRCTRNPKAHTTEECFNCEFKNDMCDSYRLAKTLYEEGYEKTDELKKEIRDLRNRLHMIWAIGCDYDGCNTVKSLKELIDELVSYTQLPEDQIPDITSRTGRWVLESDEEEPNPMFKLVKCSTCGNKANHTYKFCPNCGAKMRSDK